MTDRIEQVWSKRSMNQYIRGLWTQAGGRFDPGGPDKLPGFVIADPKAFAELIVRECVGVVEGGHFLHDQAPTALFAKECSGAIKRHFGVEEPKGWICPKCNADRTKIACPLGFGATVDGRCPMTVEAQ
jgi:hypothetical protein